MEELPQIAAASAAGRLSYSQARAITRVARRDDGIDWTDLARGASAGQLERLVRGLRRVASIEEAAADPEEADWKVRTRRRYDSDGNLVSTIITRPQYGPVIKTALAAKKAELDRQRDVACGEPVSAETPADAAPKIPAAATDGDALLALAQDALAAEQKARPDLARRRRPHLTPLVDPLSGWARQHDGELLPPASLSAVLTYSPPRISADTTSAGASGSSARHCASCSASLTANGAASPVAPDAASCTGTTSCTGATGDRPTWATWSSSSTSPSAARQCGGAVPARRRA